MYRILNPVHSLLDIPLAPPRKKEGLWDRMKSTPYVTAGIHSLVCLVAHSVNCFCAYRSIHDGWHFVRGYLLHYFKKSASQQLHNAREGGVTSYNSMLLSHFDSFLMSLKVGLVMVATGSLTFGTRAKEENDARIYQGEESEEGTDEPKPVAHAPRKVIF